MKTAGFALLAALFLSGNVYADGGDSGAKVTTLMRQPLPDCPGKDGVLVTVEFAPGHVDAAHRHPGHAFVYVLEGSVEMQMEGGELQTLKPGDTFYENPRDTHPVGRNVSKTQPAKLLVFFIADQNAPLVLPPQQEIRHAHHAEIRSARADDVSPAAGDRRDHRQADHSSYLRGDKHELRHCLTPR